MRKLSLIIIVCFSALLFSCKDELELTPFDQLEEGSALKTPTDFGAAIRGAYSSLLGVEDNEYYPSKLLIPEVLSDNLIIVQTGRKSRQLFYEFKLDANSTWSVALLYGYRSIDRANRIIANINNLSDGEFKNDILGQAKAIRALSHFDLATNFAPSFTKVNPDDANTGIPIKETADAAAKPSRSTLNQTFNFIINELKEAKELTKNDRSAVAEGILNKAAISSILARVYLYKGDYVNAKLEAQEAISLIGSANTAIASRADFPAIYKDNSPANAGVVFKLKVTEQDRIYTGTEYNQSTPTAGIRSEYVPTYELYSKYSDDDIRKSTYFNTSEFSGNLYNHIIKYSSRPGSSAGLVDVKVVRGAEVYLILAEAAARTGDDATALDALDAVRSRRYEGFSSPGENGDALLNSILLERRLELAFEGFRYYDLKRLGLPIIRSATEGDYADGSGTPAPADAQIIPANDNRFTLPIPTAERQANPNFEQSPGY